MMKAKIVFAAVSLLTLCACKRHEDTKLGALRELEGVSGAAETARIEAREGAVNAARETYEAELKRIEQEHRAKLHEIELKGIKAERDRKVGAILAEVDESRREFERKHGALEEPAPDPVPSSVPGLPPGMEPAGSAMKQVK